MDGVPEFPPGLEIPPGGLAGALAPATPGS
jgi:hypothetical protein